MTYSPDETAYITGILADYYLQPGVNKPIRDRYCTVLNRLENSRLSRENLSAIREGEERKLLDSLIARTEQMAGN